MLLILLIFRAQGQSARKESQQNPPLQRTKITDYKRDGKKGCTATCYQATTERGGAKSEGTLKIHIPSRLLRKMEIFNTAPGV